MFALADATSHLGLFAAVIAIGFIIGVYGHIIHSKTLILTGIFVVAAVSFYFVAAGEIQTMPS